MLSVFLGRTASKLPARASTILLRSTIPRVSLTRTFLTTPRLAFPTAQGKATKAEAGSKGGKATAAKTTKATTRKPAAKTPAAKKPAAKAAAKKPAAKKAATKPAKPTRAVIKPEDRPPKRPGGPFVIFYSRYHKAQPESVRHVVSEQAGISRQAAKVWYEMTPAEKKPFTDEYAEKIAEYKKAYEQWRSNVSPEVVTELNRRITARTTETKHPRKIKRRVPSLAGRPLTAFLRFYTQDFIPNWQREHAAGESNAAPMAAAAGQRWRAMSDAEKAPYVEAAARELAAFSASRPAAS